MSILIHHFVMHQLRANEKGAMSLVPNASCVALNRATTTLAQEIQQVFASKPGKGIGSFVEAESQIDVEDEGTPPEALVPFVELLSNAFASDDAFLHMSTQASQTLITTMAQDNIVETGFIVFSHYEFLATEYLFIGIINTKQHVEVSEDLELLYSDHLDIAKMQLAVRIDLTAWKVQPEQERYISFIKGRMGRKVSDFFMRFLQCEEKVDVKQQNQQLLTTVESYLAEESLSVDEKNTSLAEVQDYYKKQINSGNNIKVSDLAEVLPKRADENEVADFSVFAAHLETPLEPEFQPDGAAVRKLARFSGQGGGVTVAFDRKLLGDKVHYDPVTDTLVIKGIPPNLKDQLTNAQD
ncbi:MAG: nucleoid-associated protein YejK [Alteromonadaceae bacterium]|nr:nucleoid-associated protein YejK [Alteromonadaceae bacterium]